jgi:hypothetical protein
VLADSLRFECIKQEIEVIKKIIEGKWFYGGYSLLSYKDSKLERNEGKLFINLNWLRFGIKDGSVCSFNNEIISYKDLNKINSNIKFPKIELQYIAKDYSKKLFRAKLSFETYEDIEYGDFYFGYFTAKEDEYIRKSLKEVLKIKPTTDNYNEIQWKKNNYKILYDYSGVLIEDERYLKDGLVIQEVAYKLKNTKEWMLPEGLFTFQIQLFANKYLQNYTKVNGFQGMKWGDNIKQIKNKMGAKTKIDSSDANTIIFEDKIAGKQSKISCEFIKDKLKSAEVNFPYYDSSAVFAIYFELRNLLFEKYGLCTSSFDGRGKKMYYRIDNVSEAFLERLKETVWEFMSTSIVLSIDKIGENDYLVDCHYFDNEYFSKRKEGWKEKL